MLAKALTVLADEVIIDLEDSVAPAAKNDATRRAAADALSRPGWRAETRSVRLNSLSSPWGANDLEQIVRWAGASIHCLVIPKCESPADIQTVSALLDGLESDLGLKHRIGLEIQIEAARGRVAVEEIAASSGRLEALIFGPGDFAASLGVLEPQLGGIDDRYPGDQWHYARSRIAVAAHAFGLAAIDGPFSALHDLEGLLESARRARLLGFVGKWVLHPGQVEPCNAVFSPSLEELERARGILSALTESGSTGRGAATLGGEMIDEASRRMAEALIASAEPASEALGTDRRGEDK